MRGVGVRLKAAVAAVGADTGGEEGGGHRLGVRGVRGHTFFAGRLDGDSVVVDLGACRGDFSADVTANYGCRAFAVEASDELFASIPTSPLIDKFNLAIAAANGEATFHESSLETAGTIQGPKPNSTGRQWTVETRTLPDFIDDVADGRVDLLKVDIEGAEIGAFDVTDAEALAGVGQLTIEFHDSVRYPNVSEADVERTIAHIASMGFAGYCLGRRNMDWLFVNRRLRPIPVRTRRYLKRTASRTVAPGRSRPSSD